MVTADEAKEIVLRHLGNSSDQASNERFAIMSCELSPRGDYWVICANSEDFVIRGIFERCYVGVSAYLLSVASGQMEIVGSAQSWEQFLEDKYNLEVAAGRHYVLRPTFDKTDKIALINLRQKLNISLQESITLLSSRTNWLTGKLRVLKLVQALLAEHGIRTDIALCTDIADATQVDENVWYWDALTPLIRA